MTVSADFDLLGAIPLEGRSSIEASAGTGKTYTLSALATRYVAETDVKIDQILVVTFGRLAARELRERVRARISTTARALSGLVPTDEDDRVTRYLAEFDCKLHQNRLERALLDFDTSTITTIHSFAQQVRSMLGAFARLDLDANLKDDTDEIVNEVAADVLSEVALRSVDAHNGQVPIEAMIKSTLVELAKTALNNPGITILPDPELRESVDAGGALTEALAKRDLLGAVLREVSHRRRIRRTLSYDDVLTQLRDVLSEGSHAVDLLRRRFPVVLVDEFQDTDAVQWEIFERLFGSAGSGTRLIVVGDPKQAIYGFRGANVYSYLGATMMESVEHHRLSVNYRSDGALLTGLDCLLRGVTLGHSAIAFRPVEPSEDHRLRRLAGPSSKALPGLVIRTALGGELSRNSRGLISTGVAREAITVDLACCVHNLLQDARIPIGMSDEFRQVLSNDIAVLVSRNAEAVTIQMALQSRGIPAVVRQGISVLDTEAALQWRLLMHALSRPSDPDRARRAALGWFFAVQAQYLAGTNDDVLREIQETLVRWSEVLHRYGIVEFCSVVWAESEVMKNVLGRFNGDRNMTDLNQIATLLHRRGLLRHPTPDGVLRALDELNEIHRDESDEDLLAQQVESEAMAVQIMTIHKAKGLQFPIVCIPSMWNAVRGGDFYQDFDRNERVLAVDRSKPWPTSKESKARQRLAMKDAVGENLRQLYVALTRAEHQTIVWWTKVQGNQNSGLARVLFASGGARVDNEEGEIADFGIPADHLVVDDLRARLVPDARSNEIVIDEIGTGWPPNRLWADPEASAPRPMIDVAQLNRKFTKSHRRWSFSSMTPVDHFVSRPESLPYDPSDASLGDSGANDEPAATGDDNPDIASEREESDLPLGSLPGGTQFGTLVHEVLSEIDFTDDDLEGSLAGAVERHLCWSGLSLDQDQLVRGLRSVIETPLGPIFENRRLRDFSRGDRLDELTFELRLGRGRLHARARDIGEVLLGHLSYDDSLRHWAERVRDGLYSAELAGHLTGSIDLVARLRHESVGAPEQRFFLADYKTNILSANGGIPRSRDYHPVLLPRAMEMHHYPLQATLYAVALHRYLRWRIGNYDPKVHFGGVAYLFLRGMQGPDTPREGGCPNGVFVWEFTPELLDGLSDVLDGALELS